MQQEDVCQFIHVEIIGNMGVITLDRPDALNSLTLDMIRAISGALSAFEIDEQVRHVFIRGGQGRAFCAGGDLNSFYSSGMDYRRGTVSLKVASLYFAEEYAMNRQIHHYPKPIISFMNGITMGGGFGIAGNCKYKIATDKVIFAMPEVHIGFFPDVGSVYHLLRCSDYIGHYLALTGSKIDGYEMVFAGLADYIMPAAVEDDLLDAMARADGGQDIEEIINSLVAPLPKGNNSLKDRKDDIELIFSLASLEEMFFALDDMSDEWQSATRKKMLSASPTGLRVTFEYLKRAKGWSFEQVLVQDFILCQHFLERVDLFEGISAVIIDKSHVPRWDPPVYIDVDEKAVDEYFSSTGHELDLLEN